MSRQTAVPEKRKAPAAFCDSSSQHPLTLVSPSPNSSDAAEQPALPSPIASLDTVALSPEPGSINAILREHCRTRLYVRPIVWTRDQLRPLGCQFIKKNLPLRRRKHDQAGRRSEKLEKDTPQPQTSEREKERVKLACSLRWTDEACRVGGYIEGLLGTYYTDLSRSASALPFRVAGRVVASIHTNLVFSTGSTVFLAYLSLDTVHSLRRRYCFGKPSQQENEPVERLRWTKFQSLDLPSGAEDPYIVATLIALAQEQRCRSQPKTTGGAPDTQPQPAAPEMTEESQQTASSFKVSLLVTSETERCALYVYMATFSSAFLHKFEMPSRNSPCDPIQLSYYKLPRWKPEQLVKQLPRVLGLSRKQRRGDKKAPQVLEEDLTILCRQSMKSGRGEIEE